MNAMSLKRPYRKKVFVADSDMLLSEPFYITVSLAAPDRVRSDSEHATS